MSVRGIIWDSEMRIYTELRETTDCQLQSHRTTYEGELEGKMAQAILFRSKNNVIQNTKKSKNRR